MNDERSFVVTQRADEIQDTRPLSALQEGMLFHSLVNKHRDTYVLSALLELQASVEISALIDALQSLIDRHENLRSAVLWEGLPRPMQIVYRKARLQVDWLALDSTRGAAAQIKARMRPDHNPLDLRRAPLVRLEIAAPERADNWYALLWVHHAICDHGSLNALLAETIAILVGSRKEPPIPASSSPRLVQEHERMSGSEEAERFFKQKLSDVHQTTAPFGVVDMEDGGDVREMRLALDTALAQRMRVQAQRLGVSVARLFHAAWSLVVARTSMQDDVVFGTVVLAARNRTPATEQTLGMRVNTLPLRLRLSGLTAEQLVAHVHGELAELLEHEQFPLPLAQRCSGVEGQAPLFTSILNYRRNFGAVDSQRLADGAVRVIARGEAWTGYPITMIVDDLAAAGFTLISQTTSSIDGRAVLDYLDTALRSLVDALEQRREIAALALEILPIEARRQVIDVFSTTAAPYENEFLIHELFEQQVVRTPDALAILCEDEMLTYRQLNARANQLAEYLQMRGVGAEQLVGVCVERSVEMTVALLAVLKAGGAYVPLDPSQPVERLEHMLADVAPRVVLTQGALSHLFEQSALKTIALDSERHEIDRCSTKGLRLRSVELNSRQLAYVIYTSGSTGRPKGAMNEHRAVVNRLQWMQAQYQVGVGDRVLQKTPFGFDVSVWEFFWTLMSGACLVVARPRGHQDPEYLGRLIESACVTVLHFVPSMLQAFLAVHGEGRCKSLRHVICSGEELPRRLHERFFQLFPQVRLSNLYGPTEAAIDVTAWECEPPAAGPRVPIGRPIAGIQMYVLSQHCQPVPLGVAGELYIGGVGVGRGYLRRAELTAERFIADPFSAEANARMYRTGDVGRWRADGTIECLGRNDHQVKIRGFRIELGEIEAQLSRHERVKDAVVLAREDAQGEKQLVAYVVPAQMEHAPSVEQLRESLRTTLPDYMVPGAVVMLERLPLTPNGKLDRQALPAPKWQEQTRAQYSPPRGELEEALAEIWQGLLLVGRVDRHDNFFQRGGNSLLAVKLAIRVLDELSLRLTVPAILRHPTLREQAECLEEMRVQNRTLQDSEQSSSVDEFIL